MNRLKNAFIFAGLFLLSFQAFSQKPYFIYFQTEDNTPFFIQFNNKNYSSSSVGHLILAGLTNGTYSIQLGYPEQNTLQDYRLVVEGKDQGYLVRKMEGEKGYGIVNLQTEAVQLSGAAKKETEEAEKQKAFALAETKRIEDEKIVAAAAAETKRLEDEKAATDAKKLEEEKIAAAAAGATVIATQKTGEEKVADETAKTEEPKKSTESEPKKGSDGDKKSGAGAVVVAGAATVAGVALSNDSKKEDSVKTEQEKKTDSVKTNPNAVSQEMGSGAPPVTNNGGATVAAGTLSAAEIAALQEEARRIDAAGKRDSALAAEKTKSANTTSAPVFLDMTMTMPGDSATSKNDTSNATKLAALAAQANLDIKDTVSATSAQFVAVGDSLVVVRDTTHINQRSDTIPFVSLSNPNCKIEASDADVELISMIIKGEKNPEDALDILKKTVKVKCITTAQVRKLTLLFAADEHRYAMLDLAYRYTSDRQKYGTLSDLLTDTYYLNRFKAMVQ